jgi:hypothetical protein
MDNYYDQTKIFKFNLIPPKTKEEIVVLQERDNSTLYSFVLVFAGMFIYFVLTLIQVLLITPKVNSTELTIKNRDLEIQGYNTVRKMKGELFVKSQSLEPILDKDIKISNVLDVGQSVIDKVPQLAILSYSREINGDFVIEFTLSKIEDASLLISTLKDQNKIRNVFLRTISVDEIKHNVRLIVSFTLNN